LATQETEAPTAHETTDVSVAPEIAVTIPEGVNNFPAPEESAAATAASEPERPKSPWTPSYSVTTQGPGSDVGEPTDEQNEAVEPARQEQEQSTASGAASHVVEVRCGFPLSGLQLTASTGCCWNCGCCCYHCWRDCCQIVADLVFCELAGQ
jgi:hypothetical protein